MPDAPASPSVVAADDLPSIAIDTGGRWAPLNELLGLDGLAAGVWSHAEVGGELIEDHDETTAGAAPHDELYVVLAGRATFLVGDVEHDAPAGTIVHAAVGTRRHAVAAEPNTRVLAPGGPPGTIAAPSAWTRWQRAYALRDANDPDGALAQLRAGLEDHPGHPLIHYHLACLLCTTRGDLGEAREHLARAQAGDERTIAWAADDEDLAPLR